MINAKELHIINTSGLDFDFNEEYSNIINDNNNQ